MKPQQDQYAGPDQNAVQIFRDDVGTRVPDAASYLLGSIASSSGNAQGKLGGHKNNTVGTKPATALPALAPGARAITCGSAPAAAQLKAEK